MKTKARYLHKKIYICDPEKNKYCKDKPCEKIGVYCCKSTKNPKYAKVDKNRQPILDLQIMRWTRRYYRQRMKLRRNYRPLSEE